MKAISEKILKHKKIVIIIAVTILLAIVLTSVTVITTRNKENNKQEGIVEFEWEVYDVSGKTAYIEAIFRNEDGIKKLTYPEDETTKETFEVYPNGKGQIAIDLKLQDRVSYDFKLETATGEKKIYTLDCEIPRVKGNYKLVNGIYVNEPDITEGFLKENTRYLYMNDSGSLVPGNWITDEEPTNWYDYNSQKWANIYVETTGVDSYYVWVPRYMYKIDSTNSVTGNERMDVKFINTYNEYIDGATGNVTTYEELIAAGYQLPEAFTWKYKQTNLNLIIPGYWMSKYEVGELSSYAINYNLTASKTAFNVSNFTNNVTTTATKYTYAINGKIVNESETLDDYSFTNATPDVKNVINVTALDANGSIVGSMTKKLELTEVNKPDLAGFDPDTTFYVYWDEDGNEHNEIPISKDPPQDWYNYTYSSWANIVSRNNGLETYLVWIPRYQYLLDQTAQRSDIRFIMGIGTDVDTGYAIPEAFTWNGEQLPGYWMSKYQVNIEEANPSITAEMASGGNFIKIRDITGTIISQAVTDSTNIKYEYYLNGDKVYEGTESTENYVFTNLQLNTTYTVNIIARNSETNKYLGAITNKVTTKTANDPDLTGFDSETTCYVIYDDDGNETSRVSIKEDAPENWYDYSNRKWANIVTTANNTETYLVWIPRYEYRILSDRGNLNTANRRTDINFITTDITNNNCTKDYKVPEAFTWAGNEITGYWMSKYQLNN